MGFDDVLTTGLLALFGGAVVWAAIGALVGRFHGFEVGIATGMILFGLTGLAFAGWLAWLLWGPAPTWSSDRARSAWSACSAPSAASARWAARWCCRASSRSAGRGRPGRCRGRAPAGRSRLIVVANLVLLWGVVVGLVMDDDNLRGAQTMFRSVTVSCGCWFVASLIGGTARISQALIYLLLGGGFYLAAGSIDLFGR
jgi:hypothetical protein